VVFVDSVIGNIVYGSKNLVETLHSHGFCASYNELRRYLTSLADHEINKIENGTYIPHAEHTFSLLAEENALDFA
jgi:hypothetical protein